MTTDTITTISGLITTISAAIVVFFPAEVGPLITEIAKGVGILFVAIATYYINKKGTVSFRNLKGGGSN
jgi:hypothetical protein